MPSGASIGAIHPDNREHKREWARDSTPLNREKPFTFNRVRKDLDALREQNNRENNRENNRTVTGAYQGENRKGCRSESAAAKLHISHSIYAK
jgi:hypothetical protein